MKNWKTTSAAGIVLLMTLGHIFYPQYITGDLTEKISGAAIALGLATAKDFNVTGGTTGNVPNDASVVKDTATSDKV